MWHTIQANRDGANGKFQVDGKVVPDNTNPIAGNLIGFTETLAIGGYPQHHKFRGVTNTDFDGCIDGLHITGNPVDLNQNVQAYGVTPGCPAKFTRLVSFKPNTPGYININKVPVSNDFKINLKFKTKEKDGLIFYATNGIEDADISLAIVDGHLKLISQKIELVSTENTFNDSEWHVVNVVHNSETLRLDYDDYGFKV